MSDRSYLRRIFKPLYITWVLSVMLLAFIVLTFRAEVSDFYGIAESSETSLSYESATMVKQIAVIPGETVDAGQLLVELDRPELTMELNRLHHRLAEITADRDIWLQQTRSRISELEAEQLVTTSDLDYQLLEARSRFDLNRQLLSESTQADPVNNPEGAPSGPLSIEIERLESARRLAVEPYRIQIASLQEELANEDPRSVEIERLQTEIDLLEQEQTRLTLLAETGGMIGEVNFRNGETVPPYSTILTLHSKAPAYVRGYIHENSHNRITAGQQVQLISLTTSDYQVAGEIAGVGSRIVAFPVRLAKRPDVAIWGREVMVRILDGNDFLLGEKILIRAEAK